MSEGEALLALLEGIAPAMRAGLSPPAALRAVAGAGGLDPPTVRLLASVEALVAQGATVGAALTAMATRSLAPEMALAARAWRLSEDSGAPLAEAMVSVVRLLRSGVAQRRQVGVAWAQARATTALLTGLPLAGPGLAVAVGADPVDVYLGSGLALACLVAGLGLALLGRRWMRWLVARALSGPQLR